MDAALCGPSIFMEMIFNPAKLFVQRKLRGELVLTRIIFTVQPNWKRHVCSLFINTLL
jgi:hypothetical protein